MSKERLEEVKQTLKHPNYTEHNGQEEVFFMVSESDFQWLIEQAERVQELEEENKRYREALEFYADEDNYRVTWDDDYEPILHDGGEIARQALEGED